MSMDNFRAIDMPGNAARPVAAAVKNTAPAAKKPAVKTVKAPELPVAEPVAEAANPEAVESTTAAD